MSNCSMKFKKNKSPFLMNVTTEYRKIRLYCDTMSNTNNNDKKKWNTMHEIYGSPKLSSISHEEQKYL